MSTVDVMERTVVDEAPTALPSAQCTDGWFVQDPDEVLLPSARGRRRSSIASTLRTLELLEPTIIDVPSLRGSSPKHQSRVGLFGQNNVFVRASKEDAFKVSVVRLFGQ